MGADNLQHVSAVPDDVQRFNEQIDPYLRFLRATPGKLARLIEHTRSELVSIESERDVSMKARQVEILREQANDQLSELLLTVYSMRESIEGILERSGRSPKHPPETTEAAILQNSGSDVPGTGRCACSMPGSTRWTSSITWPVAGSRYARSKRSCRST